MAQYYKWRGLDKNAVAPPGGFTIKVGLVNHNHSTSIIIKGVALKTNYHENNLGFLMFE